MSEPIPQLWKSQKDGFQEALHYIKGRKEGVIKSLKTPWKRMNDATTDGLEWGSMTVLAGRSGTGKTTIKDQIVRELFPLNPAENFRVLEFNFEMLRRVSAIREFSSHTGKSYKNLCSAEGQLTEEDLHKCFEYAKLRVKYPIDVVEDPITVKQIVQTVDQYMEAHKKEDGSYTNTVITLDHTVLCLKAADEKDDLKMLYNLGQSITRLKRKYPIAFIILSQLNRNIEKAERNEDGKYSNYVLGSDIQGADAMLQHADTVIGLNRPGAHKIRFYGPDRFIIDNDRILVMHFLKCRNGDNRISFFNANFQKSSISEIEAPPTASRK